MEMRVLIGCETSGVVRDAFYNAGCDAWSCDLLPAETPTNRHIQGDIRDVLASSTWDLLMIAHPPCTRLCNSGVRWLHTPPPGRTRADMWAELEAGCELFSELLAADVPMVAIENPIMHKHAKTRITGYQEFTQSVQPWQFAASEDAPDNVKKRTCLWLRGLPPLEPTSTLDGTNARDTIHRAPPSPDRWKIRSRFHIGLAEAMADQWGRVAIQTPAGWTHPQQELAI